MQQRRHELPLVVHPVQVGPRGGAGADIAERVAAVELLAARGQVDAGERVADRFGRAHGHSADRVDEHGETVEPDLGVVVEPDPGGLLDGLRQQRRAAERERRVDLVLAVAGDRHVGVARDGHHRGRRARPDAGDVHQQDGVGAAVADVAAGGQFGLLFGGQALRGCPSRPAARWCPWRWRAARGSRPAQGCGAATSRSRRRRPTTATTNTSRHASTMRPHGVRLRRGLRSAGGGGCRGGLRRTGCRRRGRRWRAAGGAGWRRRRRRWRQRCGGSRRVRRPRRRRVGSSGRGGSPATVRRRRWRWRLGDATAGRAAGCRSQQEFTCDASRQPAEVAGRAARSRRTRPRRSGRAR